MAKLDTRRALASTRRVRLGRVWQVLALSAALSTGTAASAAAAGSSPPTLGSPSASVLLSRAATALLDAPATRLSGSITAGADVVRLSLVALDHLDETSGAVVVRRAGTPGSPGTLSFVTTTSALYVRANGAFWSKQLAGSASGLLAGELRPLLSKLANRWIVVSRQAAQFLGARLAARSPASVLSQMLKAVASAHPSKRRPTSRYGVPVLPIVVPKQGVIDIAMSGPPRPVALIAESTAAKGVLRFTYPPAAPVRVPAGAVNLDQLLAGILAKLPVKR